ncbi:MAG: GNAT family N-acetyltransferase [Myxococcota bacterium]
MLVRDARSSDFAAALTLNNAAVPAVNPHDAASFEQLLGWADRTWVADVDGDVGGLLVTFAPGSPYTSANYRWLSERFESFRYVDRVIVCPDHRGAGIGRALYEALESHAKSAGANSLLCEVNIDPPNPQSLAFHAAVGWRPVSDRVLGPGKAVRYLEKPLR